MFDKVWSEIITNAKVMKNARAREYASTATKSSVVMGSPGLDHNALVSGAMEDCNP